MEHGDSVQLGPLLDVFEILLLKKSLKKRVERNGRSQIMEGCGAG